MSISVVDDCERLVISIDLRPVLSVWNGAVRAGRAVAALLDEWRGARALGRLDDAALKDFGLGRSEIWAVRNGRR
jgi:uncharacterized protein YjiS (DUF1127 family)